MKTILLIVIFASFVAQPAFAETDNAFKVGVILPLSGPLAEYGVAASNGFKLAQAERPELFKNIQFLMDDSQYDNKKAISSYQAFRMAGDKSLV